MSEVELRTHGDSRKLVGESDYLVFVTVRNEQIARIIGGNVRRARKRAFPERNELRKRNSRSGEGVQPCVRHKVNDVVARARKRNAVFDGHYAAYGAGEGICVKVCVRQYDEPVPCADDIDNGFSLGDSAVHHSREGAVGGGHNAVDFGPRRGIGHVL